MTSWKYQLIRTPLQEPFSWLRHVVDTRRWLHPELKEVLAEDQLMKEILRRRLKDGSHCIDIGCHYGTMLSRMTKCAPRGRHLAFEPMPAKAAFLRRKFPETDVLQMAVSDREGVVEFYENRTASGFSGLKRHGEGSFHRALVPCTTLDQAVPADRRFDLVKIDVEGAELLVFQGARAFLERDRPVVLFECGPTGAELFGYRPVEVLELLHSYGYDVFLLRGFLDGGPPVDAARFESALEYPFQAFNWAAAPRP